MATFGELMEITIHRGTNEIGGSCVEMRSGKRRILLDAGLPLDGSATTLPLRVEGIDALFVSHCHPDHYGLASQLPEDLPVYLGELTWRFIRARHVFMNEDLPNFTTRFMHPWETIDIGEIKVTPYLMDHSSPEAFAFLVEADGKRLFYSGDFRGHGRKGKLLKNLLSNPPKKIDAMLVEGTTLGRKDQHQLSEADVEQELLSIAQNESGPVFIVCSGQNIDRIVSIFRAAKKAGRTLVIDIYTAWILEEMRCVTQNTPAMDWGGIKVLAHGWPASRQYATAKSQPDIFGGFLRRIYSLNADINLDTIRSNPGDYMIKANLWPIKRMLQETGTSKATIIYSLWPGYMSSEPGSRDMEIFEWINDAPSLTFKQVHASGHADLESLQALVKTIAPAKVIPIHTEMKNAYDKHFQQVCLLDDGQSLTLKNMENSKRK